MLYIKQNIFVVLKIVLLPLLVSCGADESSELQCSLFLFVNESEDSSGTFRISEYGFDDDLEASVNVHAYFYYPTEKCEVGNYPTPESVFDKLEAYTEDHRGQTLIYSDINNDHWVYDSYQLTERTVRRYVIGFNAEGLTSVERDIQ